jgi:hypothetical protein
VALVTMMESTYLRDGHDPASLRRLDGARLGRILLQAEMRTTPMVQLSNATAILGMYAKFATRGMHGMVGQYGCMRAL